MAWKNDIRIVVSIDFGTTYSGFAYAHKQNPELIINDTWPDVIGSIKTNTVIQYETGYRKVKAWGLPALAPRPRKRQRYFDYKPVERFKLHLGNLPDSEKPKLPETLDYEKVISDYLEEIGKLIKDTVNTRWPNVDFFENVLIILTVPAEYSEQSKLILRECMFNARLIDNQKSEKLQFTTEPEAAAIHCLSVLEEHCLTDDGISFLTIDCGGGTVDLTTRKVLPDKKLSEITERTGDFCGSTFIDEEFIKFMKFKVGESAMNLLEQQRYGQFQYMVQEFCRRVKLPFTGNKKDFKTFELDIEEVCPALKQYITGKEKETLEKNDWIIDLTFEDVKAMFDPIIQRIIDLISNQIRSGSAFTIMFLVGGFSESKYLQSWIKDTFGYIKIVAVPKQPQAAVLRGALQYGLKMDVIQTRVLKYTYGIEIESSFNEAMDPENLRVDDNYIFKFYRLVERGRQVNIDESFGGIFKPLENATKLRFSLYISTNLNETYCEGLEKLGELIVDMPDTRLGKDRPVDFRIMFGRMEITATAKNDVTGQKYEANFKLEF
ncbi:actin-like ATPase domain-containing protein [Gigaspora margarita]|uniref:Actin-like ATPase domain-containing protein n=1 Tax=Gigaspora margarita TaxID=4874 RepID=A0A8H4ELZ8_GIGMA|nr:actin-like ATPase domain-containing protein [Gigaspora margarita]